MAKTRVELPIEPLRAPVKMMERSFNAPSSTSQVTRSTKKSALKQQRERMQGTVLLISACLAAVFGMAFLFLWQEIHRLKLLIDGIPHDAMEMRDFAWGLNGGRIITSLTSPALDGTNNPPTMAIDNDLRFGRCFHFDGHKGQIGIQFASPVKVSHISVGHAKGEATNSRSPRKLIIWGFNPLAPNTSKGNARKAGPPLQNTNLRFTAIAKVDYDATQQRSVQMFKMIPEGIFEGVVVEVVDNWGGGSTCLYQIRAYGAVVADGEVERDNIRM